MLIEEIYDNIIMMKQIDAQLIKNHETNIYLMYYNYAEFNGIQSISKSDSQNVNKCGDKETME